MPRCRCRSERALELAIDEHQDASRRARPGAPGACVPRSPKADRQTPRYAAAGIVVTETATLTPDPAAWSRAPASRRRRRQGRPRSSRCRHGVSPPSTVASMSKRGGMRSKRSWRNAATAAAPAEIAIPRVSVAKARLRQPQPPIDETDTDRGDRQQVRADRHRPDDEDPVVLDDAVAGDHPGSEHEGEIAGDRARVAPGHAQDVLPHQPGLGTGSSGPTERVFPRQGHVDVGDSGVAQLVHERVDGARVHRGQDDGGPGPGRRSELGLGSRPGWRSRSSATDSIDAVSPRPPHLITQRR